MSRVIRLGDEGEHVRVMQRHLNDRLRAHGARTVPVNGKAGPKLLERVALAAWFLGALLETVREVQDGTIRVGVQEMLADPDGREPAQRRRARERRGKPLPERTPAFRILTCKEWGAVPPAGRIVRVGRPTGIVFHHTDGHCPNLDGRPGDSLEEAKAYARSIQRDHMHRNPPFIDSGHNFLVTRSGHILEGRHGSLAAIKAGVMVASAHAIGANGNPGIEHEHKGGEAMTPIQRQASLFLHELICRKTGIDPSQVLPHRKFDATECPGALLPALPRFRRDLAARLR